MGRGNIAVVKFLISEGADVNAKDKNGCTPLHWIGVLHLAKKMVRWTHNLKFLSGVYRTDTCSDWSMPFWSLTRATQNCEGWSAKWQKCRTGLLPGFLTAEAFRSIMPVGLCIRSTNSGEPVAVRNFRTGLLYGGCRVSRGFAPNRQRNRQSGTVGLGRMPIPGLTKPLDF